MEVASSSIVIFFIPEADIVIKLGINKNKTKSGIVSISDRKIREKLYIKIKELHHG